MSAADPLAAAWEAGLRRHEAALVVGARVRIRIGECEYCGSDYRTLDGQPGTIEDVSHGVAAADRDPDWQSHHYWILLDDRSRGTVGITHQAAVELQPLDADAADEEGGAG